MASVIQPQNDEYKDCYIQHVFLTLKCFTWGTNNQQKTRSENEKL
jgi:hypothetical protein